MRPGPAKPGLHAIAFAREILSRTEQYCCPIRHARPPRELHSRHAAFLTHGEAEGYHGRMLGMRRALRREAE